MVDARGFKVFEQGFAGPIHGAFDDGFAVDDDEFVVEPAAFVDVENTQALTEQVVLQVGPHEDAVCADRGLACIEPEPDTLAGLCHSAEGSDEPVGGGIGLCFKLDGKHGYVDGLLGILNEGDDAFEIGAVACVFGAHFCGGEQGQGASEE